MDVAKYLIDNGADVAAQDERGLTAVDHSTYLENLTFFLGDMGLSMTSTTFALHNAASASNVELVEHLVEECNAGKETSLRRETVCQRRQLVERVFKQMATTVCQT